MNVDACQRRALGVLCQFSPVSLRQSVWNLLGWQVVSLSSGSWSHSCLLDVWLVTYMLGFTSSPGTFSSWASLACAVLLWIVFFLGSLLLIFLFRFSNLKIWGLLLGPGPALCLFAFPLVLTWWHFTHCCHFWLIAVSGLKITEYWLTGTCTFCMWRCW